MSKRNAARPITPLRQRMIEDMTIRNLSPTTQASYVHWVKSFAFYIGRSPDRATLEEVRAFQLHLVGRKIASCPARLRHDGDVEPSRIRPAFFLRHHARSHRSAGAHTLCTQGQDAARRARRRHGRATAGSG